MRSPTERDLALVYAGEGAGPESTRLLLDALPAAIPAIARAEQISADELLAGGWERQCRVLVFPGGADLPWCRDLNGAGVARIRQFVSNGGTYFGVCAGAYFGSAELSFTADDGSQIAGRRELGFFPGRAVGPLRELASSFDPDDRATGALIPISLQPAEVTLRAFYWGGPEFVVETGLGPSSGGWRVLARYPTGKIAAVRCGHGEGRAVLCGVHPEMAPDPDRLELLRHLLAGC